jgi:hypothetical protein
MRRSLDRRDIEAKDCRVRARCQRSPAESNRVLRFRSTVSLPTSGRSAPASDSRTSSSRVTPEPILSPGRHRLETGATGNRLPHERQISIPYSPTRSAEGTILRPLPGSHPRSRRGQRRPLLYAPGPDGRGVERHTLASAISLAESGGPAPALPSSGGGSTDPSMSRRAIAVGRQRARSPDSAKSPDRFQGGGRTGCGFAFRRTSACRSVAPLP